MMNATETLKYFKSINFYPLIDTENQDYFPRTADMLQWLTQLHTFYQEALGINEGRNMHSLYNREISLQGDEVMAFPDKLIQVARLAKSLGYGYSLTLPIDRFMAIQSDLQPLLDECLLSSIGIVMDGTAEQVQEKDKEYTAFLEEMASKGLSIGLIGYMEHIDSLNLLEKACFNANSFTIYPMSQEPLGSFTRNPVTSCSRHFRILVDEKGLIYPCIGLYGLEEFALGSIYTKMEDSYFGHQQYPLDLPALIAKGPTIPEWLLADQTQRLTGMPPMCELHRLMLEASVCEEI